MSQRLQLQAPAKINLYLRVGPPTVDGFHPLLSWMCTVGLFDTLTLEAVTNANLPSVPAPALAGAQAGRTQSREGSDEREAPGSAGAVVPVVFPAVAPMIALTCDDATLPCDGKNLIVRAGVALKTALSQQSCRVSDIRAALQKRIPTGAGLGGGSSDAACMLLGLNALWNAGLDRAVLALIAANLGSDIPFFCYGPSSICTGRGEIVNPCPPPAARWALLFLPDIHMPTPAVYRRFDEMNLGNAAVILQEPDWTHWANLPANELLPLLVNDLEAPAFSIKPELATLRAKIEQAARRPVRMSGSGSSLFTLYDSESQAQVAKVELMGKLVCVQGTSTPAAVGVRLEVAELAPMSA